jgi:hypothetical protein
MRGRDAIARRVRQGEAVDVVIMSRAGARVFDDITSRYC